jgi:transcriptional regulator
MPPTADLLPGTLDMLILKAVSLKPLHGYGVLLRIRHISREALDIPQGSLYPALYRLEHQDLIEAEWGQSENGRRAKYYTVTAAGRRRLREETAGWNRLAAAIAAELRSPPPEDFDQPAQAFTWSAVFGRIESVWRDTLTRSASED